MEILRDAIDDRRRFVLLGPTGLPHCRILHVFLLEQDKNSHVITSEKKIHFSYNTLETSLGTLLLNVLEFFP